jgi:hypothetical protein
MPRTTQDFPGMDFGERKNVTHGFGTPGQMTSPLAAGENIASVTFQISVVSGVDPNPSGCLIGSPAVEQVGNLPVVIQPVQPQVAGVVYSIKSISVTTSTPPQILIAYSHLPCNPLGS